MGWIIAIFLAPILFMILAIYVVLNLVVVLMSVVFFPVVWLSHQPRRQRVELYHYEGRKG